MNGMWHVEHAQPVAHICLSKPPTFTGQLQKMDKGVRFPKITRRL